MQNQVILIGFLLVADFYHIANSRNFSNTLTIA